MDALEEASGVLRGAEQELRAILVQAAECGEYDHLPQIAEWAKLLSVALGNAPAIDPVPPRSHLVLPAPADNGVHDQSAEVRTKAEPAGPRKVKGGRRKKAKKASTRKSGYPQFVREGDSLVKIAWSKSESRPYEHKAPKGVLRALSRALAQAGEGGERFTMEELLPLKNIEDRSDIPAYQAYLVLAWLRSVSLIIQHGRQGYSLPKGVDVERESDSRWNELPVR